MEALVDGLMLAPPYVCLSLAYGLVYMLGILDLSVSARFTAAAYGGWICVRVLGWYPAVDPVVLGGSVLVAVATAAACWALLAPLARDNALVGLVGSLGLVYALQALYQLAFGAAPRVYTTYPVESGVTVFGAVGTPLQWAAMGYAVAAVVAVAILLHLPGWGQRLRAVAADPEIASAVLGIRPGRIAWASALFASVLVAPAAVLYGAGHGVSPSTGMDIGLTAFVAAIVAGRERPLGAAVTATFLVVLRSAAIRWSVWELSGAVISGGLAFWIGGCLCRAPAGRVLAGLATGAVVFLAIRTVSGASGGLLPPVVVPAEFQDVVPYVLILAGLLLRPAGLLSIQPERAV
jgi:branched-subunit amino acid ABC-type transport system permease component